MRSWMDRLLRQIVLGAALACTSGVGTAHAQAPVEVAAVPARVSVDVRVVHATRTHNRIDARLTKIMPLFKHQPYTGYDLVSEETVKLGTGAEASAAITGGRRLTVKLLDHDATQARVRIRLFRDDKVVTDSTVTIHRNRTFMIAGPKYQEGILIMPLSVRY